MISTPAVDRPTPADATVNPAIPTANVRAAPSASHSRPPTGSSTASVSRLIATIQACAPATRCRSVRMLGSITPTMLESSTSITIADVAAITAPRTVRPAPVRRPR
jgi:hypothetical protein